MKKWFAFCAEDNPRVQNRTWFHLVVHGPYGQYATTRAFWYDEF
jgi:hypothetical protein